MCTVGSDEHFLQVDFGAEVVVEAISIDSVDESFYVTEYYVEYGLDVHQLHCVISEESNGTVSSFGLSQYWWYGYNSYQFIIFPVNIHAQVWL